MLTAAERQAKRDAISTTDVLVDPDALAKIEADAPPQVVVEEATIPSEDGTEDAGDGAEDNLETPALETAREVRITQETLDRRIAKEVKKTRDQQARADVLEAKLLALENKGDEKPLSQKEVNEQAELKATQIADARIFDIATNNMVEAADKELGGSFNKLYAEFKDNVDEIPRSMIEPMLQLQNGHSVLNHLIKNPDEAEKLMAMSATRQTIELAKISSKIEASKLKPQSKAPAPIDPVGGKTRATTLPTDSDNDDDWFAKRQATKKERQYK